MVILQCLILAFLALSLAWLRLALRCEPAGWLGFPYFE